MKFEKSAKCSYIFWPYRIEQYLDVFKYTMQNIECINKVLLYNTGNYIQYPVINHNGKEYEKE